MKIVFENIPEGGYPEFDDLEGAMTCAFLECNEEVFNAMYDVKFSGSTCVTVLFMKDRIYCSNVGDSRAIKVS